MRADPSIEIAVVKQSLVEFKDRYDRDQAEFKETYRADQAEARQHREQLMSRITELNNKEQQAIGAIKMAKLGYWVLGIVVTTLSAIGLPKVAAWLLAYAR